MNERSGLALRVENASTGEVGQIASDPIRGFLIGAPDVDVGQAAAVPVLLGPLATSGRRECR